VRDYIYIDDVIDCYMSLIGGDATARSGIFNVGSGVQSEIGHVVSLIENLAETGVKALWGERPSVRPEPTVWVADVNKARSELRWMPRTTIQEGLSSTLTWMRENLQYYRGTE
jgi:nucleoside-diphosphate-sugar epimerase